MRDIHFWQLCIGMPEKDRDTDQNVGTDTHGLVSSLYHLLPVHSLPVFFIFE